MAPVVDEPQRLRLPLHCWHESLVSARTDPLVALSPDGAYIATDRPVPVGTPLFLELSSNGDGAAAEVDAVAIEGGGAEPGFAVRFVALDDVARRFIAARLAEEERAAAPDATLVPQEVEARPAVVPAEAIDVPFDEPAPRAPAAPIELSFDDQAAPLSVGDLASLVPEAEAPARVDAIEIDLSGEGAAEPGVMPAPHVPVLPAAADVGPPSAPPARAMVDDGARLDAVALPGAAAEPADELSIPEVEGQPLDEPAPAPSAPPPAAPVAPAAPLVMPSPLGAAPGTVRGPAPVPETEQTIKWARATLVAAPTTPSSSVKNPFASGDSGSMSRGPAHEQTQRFAPAPGPTPARAATPPGSSLDEGPAQVQRTERWLRPAAPSAPAPESGDVDETRPWTRANLAAASAASPPSPPPRVRTPTSPLTPAQGLPSPVLDPGDRGALPRAPMPRIASMEVPGSAPPSAVEQTQRWPTAKVRVANAPLEMPVVDVPFSQPPEMGEHEALGAGLDELFGTGEPPGGGDEAFAAPLLDHRLEVGPALETPIEIDESFEPEPIEARAPAAPPPAPSAVPPVRPPTPPVSINDTLPLGTRLPVGPPSSSVRDTQPFGTAMPPSPPSASINDTLPLGARGPGAPPSFTAPSFDATLPLGTRLPTAPPPSAAFVLDDTQPLPAAPAAAPALAGFAQRDETAPLPPAPAAAAPAESAFGHAGDFLGADDDSAFGGNAADVFGGVEITDPGTERRVPATAEDGFEAPDDIGPTLETAEPIEVGEPLELTALDDDDEPVVSAPPAPSAPTAAPSFDVKDTDAIVTAEIPAATQERLLQAALSRPSEPMVATAPPSAAPSSSSAAPAPGGAPVQVRTDPFFDRPSAEGVAVPARPEPKPTETQPYFTLGSLASSLPPLPPPPPSMTRPPPLPARAPSPPSSPVAPPAKPSSSPPPSALPLRTDPMFPRWSEAAGPTPPPSNPFAGLTPLAPASAVAPLLSNAVSAPAPAAHEESGETFFDDLAFSAAEQQRSALPAPAEQWQVEPKPASDELPTVVGDDELPTVVGRAATPSTANPWLVGEPAKKE